jgi:nicotinate-nucleotide pyrophosphorylase (carboxylating)
LPAAALTGGLLAGVSGLHAAVVRTTQPGMIAGLGFVDPAQAPGPVGTWKIVVREGERVEAGHTLIELRGTAAELAVAEDYVLGSIGFASGIATRADRFRQAAPAGMSVSCGGWKKLPAALKPLLRAGLAATGVLPRLVEGDFVYVNKNAVRLLGGVAPAIEAGVRMNHGPVAVQVCSADEALAAVAAGAGVIMVDTARLEDLAATHHALTKAVVRDRVTLAFGGGVRLEDLVPAHRAGADAVDVGRAILDAPLLDLRLEVLA